MSHTEKKVFRRDRRPRAPPHLRKIEIIQLAGCPASETVAPHRWPPPYRAMFLSTSSDFWRIW